MGAIEGAPLLDEDEMSSQNVEMRNSMSTAVATNSAAAVLVVTVCLGDKEEIGDIDGTNRAF